MFRRHATGRALSSREMAILLAVADSGSLRRAGAALGMSAAAVGKAVGLAEERLGAAVFERSTGGMVPTEAGAGLLAQGREALGALSAAAESFRAAAGRFCGLVSIGCGPIPAAAVARSLVPEACRRWPDLDFELRMGTNRELIAALAQGALDLAICHIEGVELPPSILHELVQSLQAHLLVRPGHPLLGSGPVLPAALAPYPLAGVQPHQRFRDWYLKTVGVEPHFAIMVPDIDLLAETVARSNSLLFASRFHADGLIPRYGLVELPMAWEPYRHEVHCLVAARPRSPAVAAVAALALEVLHQIEP
jgi:DNA-binding transcriptional LysR family regulator